MYALAIYSLKVGACLAVFYLFFKLLLSRETLHRFNRAVVLGAMSLSFVLPLCVITVTHELPVLPEAFFADIPVAVADSPDVPAAEPFAWERLLGAIYLLGVLGMLAATALSVSRVMRLVRSGRREQLDGGVTLVRLPQPVTPFSWWRYIVISDADCAGCGREIITHERAHLHLHHSWDLLLTDLAGCLQWFNPAMWLLRRELRAIHEYEADEAVLDSGVDARQYQLILIKKAAGGRWYSVANSFNHSKLKNRITMMLQKRSSRWAGAKALFVVPLAGLALGAFAETVYVLPQDKGMQNSVTEEFFAGKSDKQVTIRVRVVDASGEPLAGATLREHGTQHVTTTDRSGWASLRIAESSSADLSIAGYETVNLTYRGHTTSMTGRGSMRSLVQSEHEAEMLVQMCPNPIVIKGVDGSKVQEQPLYLVDGKAVADLNDVNALIPERIKTITILKDISAAPYVEKYGDKAKNGVVLITMKEPGEPDNVAPADAKDMDDVVVVGYGSFPKPEEWEAQQQKFAEMDAYFQSDEWKAKQQQLEKIDSYFQSDEWKAKEKKFAEMDAYFQSDEWKAQVKKLAEADAYFQSDEWKAVQKQLEKTDAYFKSDEWKSKVKQLTTIGTVSSVKVGAPEGSQIIYYIDGRLSNGAEVNALAPNNIASVNINKDKQPDGTTVSTIAVVTKGHGIRTVKVGAETGKTVMPVLACAGSIRSSRIGTTRVYEGKFRFTSLKNLPQDATILLDGKEVTREQLIDKKLRKAYFYMGDAAAERGNSAGVLQCSRSRK